MHGSHGGGGGGGEGGAKAASFTDRSILELKNRAISLGLGDLGYRAAACGGTALAQLDLFV